VYNDFDVGDQMVEFLVRASTKSTPLTHAWPQLRESVLEGTDNVNGKNKAANAITGNDGLNKLSGSRATTR
jgi:hypothetical protein